MNHYESLLANMQEFGDYSPAAMEALAKAKREVENQKPESIKQSTRTSFRKSTTKQTVNTQQPPVTQPSNPTPTTQPIPTTQQADKSQTISTPNIIQSTPSNNQKPMTMDPRVANVLGASMGIGGVAALG